MSASAPHAIEAQGLSKQFGGEYAVRDVTFTVPPGAIFGFIGPSGSGKTTTIRLITGVYEPTEGHVSVLGRRPRDFTPAIREHLGYMPQHFALYPGLSVWENLNFAASLYGMGFRRRKRLQEMLDFVELSGHQRKLAGNISGGMQRRLALAATLAHDPSLIILDEPTAGIDPVLRRKFWDYFHELRDRDRTLFITTQYVGEAAYCDLVGVMAEGRLLMVETPDGLRRRAFGGDVLDLRAQGRIEYRYLVNARQLPFVNGRAQLHGDNGLRVIVEDGATATPLLMEWATAQGLTLESIEPYAPPLDDVFVELVREKETEAVHAA